MSTRYQVLEDLYESPSVAVYRARDLRDGARVVLKQARDQGGGRDGLTRLRHELAMLEGIDSALVARARGIDVHAGLPALVLEDFGGESLDRLLARRRLDLDTVLRIGARIARALSEVHRAWILHRDICPNNILVDALFEVQLIDFNVSARLPRETSSLPSTDRLEGTILFISPEQTGRLSRTVDPRTDLYALGATLYMMLTGRPPFVSADPMEILHGHIARRPTPPAELDRAVPGVVSEIVVKLLAKAPEHRYRTAAGVAADIEECLARLSHDGEIAPFPIGAADASDRLQIPDRLYGREAELRAIEEAFGRVCSGAVELTLVSGAPGIGKSALIRELERSLFARRGYLAAGKFEQLKRDIPYSALFHAFGELLRQILMESAERVDAFRAALAEALGDLARVFTEAVPEVEILLGPRSSLPNLPASAAERRFRHAVLSFIQVFTAGGTPLALFLDDLQWADAASLDLLPALLRDPKAGCLMILGAYRDSEVPPSHPLRAVIARIEKAMPITRIALGPLSPEHLAQLTADALDPGPANAESRPIPAEVRSLAGLLWQKTHGNPFFAGQLLRALEQQGLIAFDANARRFRWDPAMIEAAPTADNVVDLMTERVRTLGARAQEVLCLAACVGSRFDLHTLATVEERAPEETASALGEALDEGLVLPLGEAQRLPASPRAAYRFPHDRVQQAVIEAMGEERRKLLHLRIGRLLLARASSPDGGEEVFEIVNHLNAAADLTSDPAERRRISELNLAAGRRALASAAFESAAAYLAAGIRLLPEDPFAEAHALAYGLHLGLAQYESRRGAVASAEKRFELLLRHARTEIDVARLHSHRALMFRQLGRLSESIQAGVTALAALGIQVELEASKALVFANLARTTAAIGRRPPAELFAMPEMADRRLKLAHEILSNISTAAFLASPDLFAILVLKAAALSAEHGSTSQSAGSYVGYGMLLTQLVGDYEQGDAFGQLALRLVDRYPDKGLETSIKCIYGSFLRAWRHPIDGALQLLKEAGRAGAESGNFTYAVYALDNCARAMLWRCRDVAAFQRELTAMMDGARRMAVENAFMSMRLTRQLALALEGRTRSPDSLETDDFDEARFVAEIHANEALVLRHYYWVNKGRLLFLHGYRGEALELLLRAAETADATLFGLIEQSTYHIYVALALAAACERACGIDRQAKLLRARSSLRKLRRWASGAPANFEHHAELVAAELARVGRDDGAALRHYTQAIELARRNDFPLDEALSEELAGGFHASRGAVDAARDHLSRARRCYERVGAFAKVRLLDARHPELAARAPSRARYTTGGLSSSTTHSAHSWAFDIPSLIKAAQALSGEIDLNRLLMRLMHIIAENAGAERGALLLQRGQEIFVVAEVSMERGALVPETPPRVEERGDLPSGVVRYVVRTQKMVVLGDAQKEGAELSREPYITRVKPKSLLCMPVIHQGDARGALYLENNLIDSAFTAERIEMLGVLCAQMAISIENAILYADLDQRVALRTRELREAQAQIVKLEKAATEAQMAGGFAHELGNALSPAGLALSAVKRSGGEAARRLLLQENALLLRELSLRVREHVPEEEHEHLAAVMRRIRRNEEELDEARASIEKAFTSVERAFGRALALTDKVLSYARLSREQPGNDRIHLRPLIESIVGESTEDLAEHGIAVDIDVPAETAIDGREADIHSIVKNLVTNARHAVVSREAPGERRIRITVSEEPRQSVLVVEDTGVGIAPGDRERIFNPFFSTRPASGTGLGLSVVRKITELYGGAVTFDSEPGRGTAFRVTFPRRPPSARPPAPA